MCKNKYLIIVTIYQALQNHPLLKPPLMLARGHICLHSQFNWIGVNDRYKIQYLKAPIHGMLNKQ